MSPPKIEVSVADVTPVRERTLSSSLAIVLVFTILASAAYSIIASDDSVRFDTCRPAEVSALAGPR
jgi:hypothetical protein